MSDCPWRKLESDGLVDHCVANRGHTPGSTDCGVGHAGERGCFLEDDPLAWDATCPDCGGRKWANRDPARKHGKNTPCPTCEGVGTVDTVPPSLIGVGSIISDHPVEGEFGFGTAIITGTTEYGQWLVRPHPDGVDGGFLRVEKGDVGPDGTWQASRAVPPLAEEPADG